MMSINNLTNESLIYPKHFCYCVLFLTFNVQFSNLTGLFKSEFHSCRAYAQRVSFIFATGTPFKIFNSIIGFHSILMVHLWKMKWIRNKCFSDKSMYCRMHCLSQRNTRIALPSHVHFTEATIMTSSLFRITPHSTIFSNCIQALKSFNIFHTINSEKARRFASIVPLQSAKLLMQ